MNDTSPGQPTTMRSYYRLHAGIYDTTRWSFLFGRKSILQQLNIARNARQLLLEVGCGTGHNLRWLAEHYPLLQLAGVDVSPDMLFQAEKSLSNYGGRVHLFEQAYGSTSLNIPQKPDFILFSYALTMFNPGWEDAVGRAWEGLPPGGRVAVVDFHDTPSRMFRWWMQQNHVRMESHLLPVLQSKFKTELLEVHPAWLGLWRYFLFVGQKF